MKKFFICTLVLVSTLTLAACNDKDKTEVSQAQASTPAQPTQPQQPGPATKQQSGSSGKVVETMNAAGYTSAPNLASYYGKSSDIAHLPRQVAHHPLIVEHSRLFGSHEPVTKQFHRLSLLHLARIKSGPARRCKGIR